MPTIVKSIADNWANRQNVTKVAKRGPYLGLFIIA